MKKTNTPTPSPDHQDEAFFDEYLQGKSQLSELYQEADCPEPSDELNQSILLAAKASTEKASITPPVKTHWWMQPASWAASIAIFSLVGILAHNTWRAEQSALEKDFFQTSPVNKNSVHKNQEQSVFSTPLPGRARTESNRQTGNSARPLAQAKKRIPQEEKNDSRKLLYKSESAPVMQAAPEYMMRSQMGYVPDEMDTHVQEMIDASDNIQSTSKSEIEVEEKEQISLSVQKQKKFNVHTKEQQLWLEKISQLIENDKRDEAQELLLQFKIKYPDYPIDPVILQHLSPY